MTYCLVTESKNNRHMITALMYILFCFVVNVYNIDSVEASERNYLYYNTLDPAHSKSYAPLGLLITIEGDRVGSISYPMRYTDSSGEESFLLTTGNTIELCSNEKWHICFHDPNVAFVVPRNLDYEKSSWSYKFFRFTIMGILELPGLEGKILQIDVYNERINKKVWRVLYNTIIGIYAIAPHACPKNTQNECFENLYIAFGDRLGSEPSQTID